MTLTPWVVQMVCSEGGSVSSVTKVWICDRCEIRTGALRRGAVRADIAQSKCFALAGPREEHGFARQHFAPQAADVENRHKHWLILKKSSFRPMA